MCTYSSTNITLYMFSLLYIGLRKPWVWQQYWGTPAISSERKLHHSQFKHKSGFRPQNQTVCQEEFRHRSGRGKDRGYRLHYKGHAHDISARWVALRRGGWCFFPIYFRDKKLYFLSLLKGSQVQWVFIRQLEYTIHVWIQHPSVKKSEKSSEASNSLLKSITNNSTLIRIQDVIYTCL